MSRTPHDPEGLKQRRDKIREELVSIGDLRPGSLADRYRRCGKPSCHCAGEGDPGHGPSWSLTRKVQGKTVTKVIPLEAVEQTREQIAEYRRFRRLTSELVEVSEELCDAQLRVGRNAEGSAKKGASKKSSKQRSSRKSRPS